MFKQLGPKLLLELHIMCFRINAIILSIKLSLLNTFFCGNFVNKVLGMPDNSDYILIAHVTHSYKIGLQGKICQSL